MHDDEDFHYSSDAEIDQDDAALAGETRTDRAWILSNRDVWYRNPHYRGPAVPHPEEYDDEAIQAEWKEQQEADARGLGADYLDAQQ